MGRGCLRERLGRSLKKVIVARKGRNLGCGAPVSNHHRMAYGLSTLMIDTYSKWQEDRKTVTIADFTPSATEGMGNHFPPNANMGPAGRYPLLARFPQTQYKNQNLVWPLIYGAEHYPVRGASLDFLTARNVGNPEFFSVPFLAAIWERMTIDYTHKDVEEVRCLTQLGSKSNGLDEQKRLARHSEGWTYRTVRPSWNLERGIGEDTYCRKSTWEQGGLNFAEPCPRC